MSEAREVAGRLGQAAGLPSVLATAHDAFDAIGSAIRGREDPASGMFAALVMSEVAAIDGRDAITRAPSFPGQACLTRLLGGASPRISDLALELAGLAGALAARLASAVQEAELAGDQEACAEAAACAREIHDLLAGAASG
jgi:hypothetical protein